MPWLHRSCSLPSRSIQYFWAPGPSLVWFTRFPWLSSFLKDKSSLNIVSRFLFHIFRLGTSLIPKRGGTWYSTMTLSQDQNYISHNSSTPTDCSGMDSWRLGGSWEPSWVVTGVPRQLARSSGWLGYRRKWELGKYHHPSERSWENPPQQNKHENGRGERSSRWRRFKCSSILTFYRELLTMTLFNATAVREAAKSSTLASESSTLNQCILVFTVMTVVYLPLSFTAVNISTYLHDHPLIGSRDFLPRTYFNWKSLTKRRLSSSQSYLWLCQRILYPDSWFGLSEKKNADRFSDSGGRAYLH